MKIEILYPESCNLYGDSANMKYLRLCLPDAEFIETGFGDRPVFADGDADLVYMGSMPERAQELAIKKLTPYKEELQNEINSGTHFLFTGNSFEILGNYIADGNIKIDALEIIGMYAERKMQSRYNGIFLGEFEGIKITAFNSRFSHSYTGTEVTGFASVMRGIGLNEACPFEGVRINNFIGTYLIGPLIVQNPHFCAYLLKSLGTECTPAFFEQSLSAYEKRLSEFTALRSGG